MAGGAGVAQGNANSAATGGAAGPEHRATPDPQVAKRALLPANEKEFRAGVERLYQLTGELRDEVRKTLTTDVMSVRMYKKTEEIEKLAKQLRKSERTVTGDSGR
jgi:hypothetical protein